MAPEKLREILARYREGLAAALGDGLAQVIRYGSHARQDAHGGSDIDVLCLMRGPFDYGKAIKKNFRINSSAQPSIRRYSFARIRHGTGVQ